jgi:hypothetical protein
MSVREKLEETMHEAMRNRDELTRNTIRLVLAAIKQVEIDSRIKLDDAGMLAVLQKEVKIRNETISELSGANRDDLVAKANAELEILSKFLPAQLSDEDLIAIARKKISEISASTPADMGKVMKELLPLVKGQAQPDRVSRVVKDLLNG